MTEIESTGISWLMSSARVASDVGFFTSRMLLRGGGLAEIEAMEAHAARAVEELASIPVDAIVRHLRFSPAGSKLVATTVIDGAWTATVWDVPSGTMSFSMSPGGGDADAFTREVIRRVQEDGTLWLSGTTWHGMAAMRICVSNWSTSEADADRSVDAILRCAASA